MGPGRGRSSLSRTFTTFRSRCLAFAAFFFLTASFLVAGTRIDNGVLVVDVDDRGDLAQIVVKRFGETIMVPRYGIDEKGWQGEALGGLRFGLPFPKKLSLPTEGELRVVEVMDRPFSVDFTMNSTTAADLPEGMEIRRSYRFFPGRSTFEVDLVVSNVGERLLNLNRGDEGVYGLYLGPRANQGDTSRDLTEVLYAGKGEVDILSPKKLELQSPPPSASWIGWRSSFYAAVLEERDRTGTYFHCSLPVVEPGDKKADANLVGCTLPVKNLRKDETIELHFRIYLGTKTEEELAEAGYPRVFNNWDGWTGPIGKMMFFLLKFFHGLTQSWGYAILLLTVLVKLLLHPINRKQIVAMKKMQDLQPKMAEIRETYKKDPNRQNQEMQKLFVENEVNPMSGCLPIFIQLPIFIALYTCLGSAIQLKNVAFWWLPDLSLADPLRLLPLIFAASIYFSSAGKGGDPSQAMMMKIMPIMMFLLMSGISSGVMLYLAGQGVLGILEQRYNEALMGTGKRGKHDDEKVRRQGKDGPGGA